MILDRNIRTYCVFAEDPLRAALEKIDASRNRIIFAVTEDGVIEGVLSDGDFRRWALQAGSADLSRPVLEAVNRDFVSASIHDPPERILGLLGERIQAVPVLDERGRLTAIARERRASDGVRIGNFLVSDESPAFIIAEIGNNHNGSPELARKLVDAAIESGADCVKFQMRNMDALYRSANAADDASEDLGSQYVLDLLSRYQLESDELLRIFDYCRERGALPLCTAWDEASLETLLEYGMPAVKFASADFTNHDLLSLAARSGTTLLCSTGMSTEAEIIESANLLKRLGSQYILLHCNSAYPAPFRDLHLEYMDKLKEIGECVVGYSGHERGIYIPIAAVARGARVIEKHFTLDKTLEGNDHKVSLLPEEFREMTRGIRETEEALGDSGPRKLSQGEWMNRETLAKSLVSAGNIEVGQVIREDMLAVRSPGKGLQPNRKRELIGRIALRSMAPGDFFFPADLEESRAEPRPYSFSRPWGVPVRHHDYRLLADRAAPDLLEFHLSYKDLELKLEDYFDREFSARLVVHSPELFAGDHLLDLCAEDEEYRRRSVAELERVAETTRRLKQYFPGESRPCIITNVGGFSADESLPAGKRKDLYDRLARSLDRANLDGVEVIPQSMPPFPWHFGGQRYHNLFLDPEDTEAFCREHGLRICLDVSHSKLAANHLKIDFLRLLEAMAPLAAHLHIADASGVDGEGLQIGEGDMDFIALWESLDRLAPDVGFIPEIWQGHKNDGEGFWIALERLEAAARRKRPDASPA